MDITLAISFKSLTEDANFFNYLLIVYAYSKLPVIYGMENTTTDKVVEKIYMFQDIFEKVYEFGWWNFERI